MPSTNARSTIVFVAIACAGLAWLLLLLGLVYANLVVTEPPPNVVITFSNKGLARLFVELISFGIGCLGIVLAVVAAVTRTAGPRLLTLATVSNVAVCAACIVLLM